jgi:hypothetical protein
MEPGTHSRCLGHLLMGPAGLRAPRQGTEPLTCRCAKAYLARHVLETHPGTWQMSCVKGTHGRPVPPQVYRAVSADPVIIPGNKHNKVARQPR